jgi:transposase
MAARRRWVITSVQRRRCWSRAEKERIVAAAIEPGAVASEVAPASGIYASQLFGSRRQLCEPAQSPNTDCAEPQADWPCFADRSSNRSSRGRTAPPARRAADQIGVTLSLTGGTDDAGQGARMGAELALKEYDDKCGYKGQKVETVIYDDETKPAKGVALAT